MSDYQKYINALRKCAKEHEGDKTFTGQIIVSNLCRDTADLLEKLEQEPISDILEDIYTEIEDEYEDCVIGKLDDDDDIIYPCFRQITDIYGVLNTIDKYIDKYKPESEEV